MADHMTAAWASQQAVEISDSSDVAQIRRLASHAGSRADFDDVKSANLALVATELATNVVKHARRGSIVVRLLTLRQNIAVELLALDQGPGIRDIAHAMRDGYSTAGSPGTGLGAIKRLADEFDIYSIPDKGTAVIARLSVSSKEPSDHRVEIGAICLPKQGEEVSGDGWGVENFAGRFICTLVDGLGHGPDAAVAARAAIAIAQEHGDKAPAEIVERAHGALRSTRGAALAVGAIDVEKRSLRFCGIGNIAARIIGDGNVRHLVSLNGIVGQDTRKIVEFSYPWSSESTLIMHSDGLSSRWDLASYPALIRRHPALIAGVLYRDLARGRDDVTVLTARELGHSL
jgi:anti-sigma regulatory factor (Ser/Thr protein kinase)